MRFSPLLFSSSPLLLFSTSYLLTFSNSILQQPSDLFDAHFDVVLVVRLDGIDRLRGMAPQEMKKFLEINIAQAKGPVKIIGPVVVVEVHLDEPLSENVEPLLHGRRGEDVEMSRIKAEAEVRAVHLLNEHGKRLGVLVEDILYGHAHARPGGGVHYPGPGIETVVKPDVLPAAVPPPVVSRVEHCRAGLEYGGDVHDLTETELGHGFDHGVDRPGAHVHKGRVQGPSQGSRGAFPDRASPADRGPWRENRSRGHTSVF